MPAPVRPKGSGSSRSSAPVTPMSERQQMALLMQLTSAGGGGGNEVGSRSPSSSGVGSGSVGSGGTPGGTRASREQRNERGETPLHLAAIKGDVEQVSRLLAHRADPNAADFAGWTPLHEACNHGRFEVALRLVQSGANVNARGLDDDTPLHDAAANGHLRLARMLVERGADVRAKNAKGRTPLDVCPGNMKTYLLDMSLPLPESTTGRLQPRTRDDKKVTGTPTTSGSGPAGSVGPGGGAESTASGNQQAGKQKTEEAMDLKGGSSAIASTEDVYEFKTGKEATGALPESGSDSQVPGGDKVEMDADNPGPTSSSSFTTQSNEESGTGASSGTTFGSSSSSKRGFSEVGSDAGEESVTAGSGGNANSSNNNDDESRKRKRKDEVAKEGKAAAPRNVGQNKGQTGKQSSGNQGKSAASNASKNVDKKSPCPSPKPSTSDPEIEDGKADLKVPPLKIVIPQTNNSEQETTGRNGKNSSQRTHPALPYVVASSNTSANAADTSTNDKEQSAAAISSMEMSSSSKSEDKKDSSFATSEEALPLSEADTSTTSSTMPAPVQTTAPTPPAPPVDLHPRKRKIKQNKESAAAAASAATQQETVEPPSEAQVHPHEQPITNCYKLFLDIREQITNRRKGLFPVQPKPPSGFKDYLMNRCTYVLASNAPTSPNINYPQNLPPQLKDIFSEQEKERYRLRTQHVIEKEKLVLSVEQEILRVHGRAARALANQSLPFSVCTILRDKEVYNLITPEQEEKDRNARSRYNGRLFLSWLQDVDDKWEKIKESMLLRHHNEAESLHAVQKMDWEWKMKELNLCDIKTTPKIDETHVPMVHVSDDFDLLPA